MLLLNIDDHNSFSGLIAITLMVPAFIFMWVALRRQKKQSGQVEKTLENERQQIALSERIVEVLESIDKKLDDQP